ncbi:hypothetical protein FisN_8Lu340 [Fistulifera solaris]|uniref:Uncharacterized protein n=1 Tax=Fistulifera solaris TaxID=1519565 RepID=A0A1Z5JN38_FISSO|nr:hypothetical protein FisN_8Lu340 [Fistulifera solaris]|eukprot:GAX15427.1 hypothetical protein FisN_8Lu340 [Fistulifera solaris]
MTFTLFQRKIGPHTCHNQATWRWNVAIVDTFPSTPCTSWHRLERRSPEAVQPKVAIKVAVTISLALA